MNKSIILFGPQGSGKGTQASLIHKNFNIPHISTGDIFRENIKNETELGKKVQQIINEGHLVLDEITNEIVKDRLEKEDCQNGFILDGFPRNLKQAEFLDSFIKIDLALEIWISDEEAVERIGQRRTCSACGSIYHLTHITPREEGICDKCGGKLVIREDDREDAIKKRLKTYHEQSDDIIDHYEKLGVYTRVDGMRSIEDVNTDVTKLLSS